MAKRGRPAKQSALDKILETPSETVSKPHKKPIVPNISMDTGFSTEGAYDEYDKYMAQEIANEQELTEQEAVEPATTAKVEPDPEIQAAEEQPAEQEAVEEVQQKSEPSKKEEYLTETKQETKIEKTVPLAALHESREKEKQERLKRLELERRIAELEANKPAPASVDDEYEYVPKSEFKVVKEQLAQIEKDKKAQELKRQVADTDEVLSKEGTFGFKDYGHMIVDRRLNEMYAEDPAYAIAHDNPEGWAKIWREEYPKMKQKLIQQDMQAIIQKKEELKKTAGMVGNPGIKGVKVKNETETPKTREEANSEYVRSLRTNSL